MTTKTLAQPLVVALLRAADHFTRSVSVVLAERDLTGQQYNVLRILRGAGDEPLPTLEIAERMIERAPGITRLIDRLEAKGLVERARCPEDRRLVRCRITPSGLALLADLDEPVQRADDALVAGLSTAEQEVLVFLLERVGGARR